MTQTASRYARVLWELGIPEESIGDSLSIFKSSPELREVLLGPEFHTEEREAAIDRIFPGDMRNFMKVLCRHGCAGSFEEIAEQYRIYANAHSRIVSATLTYVNPPNEKQMEGIKKFLCRTYNAVDVDLQEFPDPSLLGGFILTAGDDEYDWSLRGRINALSNKLAGGEDR